MKISRNLWIFCIINLISSIVFFTYLGNSVSELDASNTTQNSTLALIAPFIYGTVWFFTGLILGITDSARKTRSDLGLMYHTATIIVLFIGVIYWAIMFEKFRTWQFIILPLFFTAITIVVHWLATRNNIKGISKTDAFK